MKDLEKIKSEDLGCQVQDANPGNFAIEQEVAQLVGATVPAPTEPSADDARELGAQLLVFLRRALLPIRSALRTAVAAIYAHLDSRCTAYTPAAYAPMGTPPTPRTLPNLLTAITAFSPRKISNGSAPNDGIPDGVSLAHLLCSTSAANAVTEIKDDNYGWTCNKSNILQTLMGIFDSARTFTLGCKKVTASLVGEFYNNSREYNIHFPWLTELSDLRLIADEYENRNPTFNVYVESLRHTNQTSNTYTSFFCKRLYAPVYESGVFLQGGSGSYGYTYMRYMLFGCTGAKNTLVRIWSYKSNNGVTDFEIGDKEYIDAGKTPRWVPCQSLTLTGFGNLTAENMYNHILCRLKQDEPNCGSGVTITLGTTNIEKLEAVDEYNTKLTELEDTYGYTFA